jgi:peptidoglycan/xylan/chitin deacetylase (PgdA/CDA1 family)
MNLIMFLEILLPVLVILPGVYLLIPWWIRNLLRKRFLQRMRNQSGLCVTFDDGPHPESTPLILDLLKKHGAKATFFLVGRHAEKHPELTKRILSEGHEVGFHSYAHKHPWLTGPVGTWLDLTRDPIPYGPTPEANSKKMIRPPYGKLNLVSMLYIWLKGFHIVFWTLDPKDYLRSSAHEIVDFVFTHLSGGSVILLHDGSPGGAPQQQKTVTAEALDKILAKAKEREWKTRTILDLLGVKKR